MFQVVEFADRGAGQSIVRGSYTDKGRAIETVYACDLDPNPMIVADMSDDGRIIFYNAAYRDL